ncbi:MAG TPA: hypothetical protein VMU67_06480 [Steroidobacteraceae bacterium]|nr:hypothetical protein [Steroidobacteraceae bacterium]
MARARRFSSRAALLAGLMCAGTWVGPAHASAPPTDGSFTGKASQEVTVTARRAKLAPRVRAFVSKIAALEQDAGLARWHAPVCPSVTGFTRRGGEFVLERISDIARAAAVPLAAEHCRANLYIFVTSDPRRLLRAMEKRNRAVTFGNFTPPLAVDEFIASSVPVRVWYNSNSVTPDYLPATRGMPPFVQLINSPVGSAPITSDWERASHVTSTQVWTFSYVYVIVDRTRLQQVTLGQLADYVGMVGLARLKATEGLGDVPTILKLFDGTPQAAPAGLSAWDLAFLKSLYATEQRSKVQRALIAQQMVRSIVPR